MMTRERLTPQSMAAATPTFCRGQSLPFVAWFASSAENVQSKMDTDEDFPISAVVGALRRVCAWHAPCSSWFKASHALRFHI